jgi:EAL domain-containing protein (putative c-di-GMP-specific phosphodiesterase class I)
LRPGGIAAVTQPIVRLSDGAVLGYESLARSVEHPEIGPDRWLSYANDAGVGLEAELACLSAAALCGTPPDNARLFVNVSARLLLDPRTAAVLRTLPPHVLEITEHEQITDYQPLVSRLRALTADGALVAVDDVGSGYANMAHVLHLMPAFLKIDRSLISSVQVDGHKQALVSALVAFGRQVGAMCIAEGVETAEELGALRDLDVDLVQGYLLARPGVGWPVPAQVIRSAAGVSRAALDVAAVSEQLANATNQNAAATVITRYLFETCGLLPSVYLHAAGALRCLSRRGQWLVLDGMPAGVGITGVTYAAETETYLSDVAADPRYRSAIPGVRSELCVPLAAGEAGIVGVLNAESKAEMSGDQRFAVRGCAQLLGRRLAEIGGVSQQRSALEVLAAEIPGILGSGDPGAAVVAAACAVTGLETSCLWLRDAAGLLRRAAAIGPEAGPLGALTSGRVARLAELVDGVASCYSGGGAFDLAATQIDELREDGVRALLLTPLRRGEEQVGLLASLSHQRTMVSSEQARAAELLASYAVAVL